MKSFFFIASFIFITQSAFSMVDIKMVNMDTLPYYEIPAYPAQYTPETVVARMIDGLGFRFYWATEGLRPQDLSYKPTKESRTSEETIDHILGLSYIIINALRHEVNGKSGEETSSLAYNVKRKTTLETLKAASELLKSGQLKLEDCKVLFKSGDKITEYPFWNGINGPVEDAVWHVGQVVTFRRSSGNPFNGKASVFTGKLRP